MKAQPPLSSVVTSHGPSFPTTHLQGSSWLRQVPGGQSRQRSSLGFSFTFYCFSYRRSTQSYIHHLHHDGAPGSWEASNLCDVSSEDNQTLSAIPAFSLTQCVTGRHRVTPQPKERGACSEIFGRNPYTQSFIMEIIVILLFTEPRLEHNYSYSIMVITINLLYPT